MACESIRIPCSSGRGTAGVYAKLLSRVSPTASNGFGWEGSLLKPGAVVAWDALWPTPAHPRIPVLLECAGAQKVAYGHNAQRAEQLYILWRLDVKRREWDVVARAAGEAWSWAVDLCPVAVRVLEDQRREVQVFGGFDQVVSRMGRFLDWQLERLPEMERGRAVGVLHDQLCSRMVSLSVRA